MRREADNYNIRSRGSSPLSSPRMHNRQPLKPDDLSTRLRSGSKVSFPEEADRDYGRRLFRGWKAVVRKGKYLR